MSKMHVADFTWTRTPFGTWTTNAKGKSFPTGPDAPDVRCNDDFIVTLSKKSTERFWTTTMPDTERVAVSGDLREAAAHAAQRIRRAIVAKSKTDPSMIESFKPTPSTEDRFVATQAIADGERRNALLRAENSIRHLRSALDEIEMYTKRERGEGHSIAVATARNMGQHTSDLTEALGRLYLLKELGIVPSKET